MINLAFKIVFSLFFTGLTVVSYNTPLPLIIYNAKYPFIAPGLLELLFAIYPFANLLIVAGIWTFAKAGKALVLLITALYMTYHVKLLVSTDCAVCAARGLVPSLGLNQQIALFSVVSLLAFVYFFLPENGRMKRGLIWALMITGGKARQKSGLQSASPGYK